MDFLKILFPFLVIFFKENSKKKMFWQIFKRSKHNAVYWLPSCQPFFMLYFFSFMYMYAPHTYTVQVLIAFSSFSWFSWPFFVMKMNYTLQYFIAQSVTHTCASNVQRQHTLRALWHVTRECLYQRSLEKTQSVSIIPCIWWSLHVWKMSANVPLSCAIYVKITAVTWNTRYGNCHSV